MESRVRLQKSRTDRMIDGVCGGVAAYFGIDPTLVRVAWVLLTFFGGSGVVLYIACMILMPKEPAAAVAAAGAPDAAAPAGPHPAAGAGGRNPKFWGVLLIVVGGLWLLGNPDVIEHSIVFTRLEWGHSLSFELQHYTQWRHQNRRMAKSIRLF